MKRLFKIFDQLFLCIGALLLAACGDVRLLKPPGEVPNSVKSVGKLCVSEPQEVLAYTKFLFVVDKSGSNAGEGGARATDRNAVKRAGNIEKFIRQNLNKTHYHYGMIGFYDHVADAYIEDGEGPSFTTDPQRALEAANRLRQGDSGLTPYKAALLATRLAIKKAMAANPNERSVYMVFFLSDGEPMPKETQPDKEIFDLVRDIVENQPRPVFLSTAYYGNKGGGAVERLQKMAEIGKGKFINFEMQSEWDFNDLIVKPTVQPWLLKSLLVYNINAGFCLDGKVDVDSDGDGMCDRDELKYPGFDPTNRFSFNDGYGDYFHWRRLNYGESLPPCDDRTDLDFDLLTNCEEAYIRNDNPPPGVGMVGNIGNPDTDRDGILDGIETFVYFTRTLAFAMDPSNLSRSMFDGEEEAGLQISQHRSPVIRDPHQIAYDTTLEPVYDSGRDCYKFSQNILPLYETLEVKPENTLPYLAHGPDENIVYLYYLQTPQSDPTGDGILRYSFQNLKRDPKNSIFLGERAGLKVDDAVFKSYVIPLK